MNLSDKRRLSVRTTVSFLLAGILAVLSSFVQAANVEISAKFSPDPANPHFNEFTNTTPNSGLCRTFPSFCASQGLYSIYLGFEAQSTRPILANHTDIRQGAMIKVPADVRHIQVVSATGQTADLAFSIVAFSGTNRTRDVREITGMSGNANLVNDVLWNGRSWGRYTPAPCLRGASMNASAIDSDFFWLTPQSLACGKSPTFDIDSLRLRNASVSYLMTTPDPLKMESGVYRGSITYLVGRDMDFDFGDVLDPTDSSVTLNFTLEVQHTLKFLFPAGGNQLTLNPAGGWQQWLNHGRRPENLLADQDFKIWSSTLFSMRFQCEYPMGAHCGIKNPAGDTVPVETRVTLPDGLHDESNRPVSRSLLSPDPSRFRPTYYVDNGRAALHFEVDREQVKGMIDEHSGSTYSGNITIIFDSSLPP